MGILCMTLYYDVETEALVLDLLVEGNIASLPSPSDPFCLGVVVPLRVPSIGQIDPFENYVFSI